MGKRKGTHRKLSLAEAVAQVDKLEAMLARKTWAPTTSMLIPSILMSADALLKQLRYQAYKSRSDALLQAQVERLEMLCSNFKRQS